MKKYQVELEDVNTGACSPVDMICVNDDYTEEDYREDCFANGCDIPYDCNVVFIPLDFDSHEDLTQEYVESDEEAVVKCC